MQNMKVQAYSNLVSRVKQSYPSYEKTEETEGVRLYWCNDCEEINLWTYWQGRENLTPKIILVGQDWGCPWDTDYEPTMAQIRKANLKDEYNYLSNNPSPTDANLIMLFDALGYDITKPCADLFFTNFVLGYRNHGLSGGYKKVWAEHDGCYFKELANLLEPKVILCLSRSTFEGVLYSFDVKLSTRIKNYNTFIESPNNPIAVPLENGNTTYIFALAHCGTMGTLNRNSKKSADLSKQVEDWRRIKPYLNK